jgi:hypothetical protein
MKKVGLTTLLLAAMLSGCTATPVISSTQYVNVLVPVKCSPTLQVTSISEYPTSKFKVDMSLFEKTQLIMAELFLIRGQNKELTAALGECTK